MLKMLSGRYGTEVCQKIIWAKLNDIERGGGGGGLGQVELYVEDMQNQMALFMI